MPAPGLAPQALPPQNAPGPRTAAVEIPKGESFGGTLFWGSRFLGEPLFGVSFSPPASRPPFSPRLLRPTRGGHGSPAEPRGWFYDDFYDFLFLFFFFFSPPAPVKKERKKKKKKPKTCKNENRLGGRRPGRSAPLVGRLRLVFRGGKIIKKKGRKGGNKARQRPGEWG